MSGLSPRDLGLLHEIGVQVWLPRDAQPVTEQSREAVPVAGTGAAGARPVARTSASGAGLDWDALERTVARCTACDLHRGRTQTVFGTGDRKARWMIIGEAPGAEEDRRGEPFVGRAGQLLNAMLLAAGFRRQEVYIANVVKCRPPDNRDPRPAEAECCAPFLQRQIELVAPELLIAVGRVAAQRLLQTETPVGRLRGRLHRFGAEPGLPLVVTYHPAYLLRSPREKAKVWQDLQFALDQTPAPA